MRETALAKHTRVQLISLRRKLKSPKPYGPVTAILPKAIWMLVLSYLDEDDCIYRQHKNLYSLSLTCRFFNEYATTVLYGTLDLQFNGQRDSMPLKPFSHVDLEAPTCSCPSHIKAHESPISNTLRRKLDKLILTLKSRPDLTARIRHLKLPNQYLPSDIRYLPYDKLNRRLKEIYCSLLERWFRIFSICSSTLESVSGLGNLWPELQYRCFRRAEIQYRLDRRPELPNELWTALEENQNWTRWDFTNWYTALLPGTDLEIFRRNMDGICDWSPERMRRTFLGWTNLEHVEIANPAWMQKGLHLLPNLRSVAIHTNCHTNYNDIFEHLPLRGIESITYDCFERTPRNTVEMTSEPFGPLINYLRNARRLSLKLRPSTIPTLTHLNINFQWWTKGRPLGMGTFNHLAFSIFTLVPLLQELKLILVTLHERTLGSSVEEANEKHTIWDTIFTAQHLRKMTISLPARTNKEWLANKIVTGAFPALTDFTFRSAMSRDHDQTCSCEMEQDSLLWYKFGQAQDETMVNACQAAGIPRWTMQIRSNPENACPIFLINHELEHGSQSLYRRAPWMPGPGKLAYAGTSRILGGTICEVIDF